MLYDFFFGQVFGFVDHVDVADIRLEDLQGYENPADEFFHRIVVFAIPAERLFLASCGNQEIDILVLERIVFVFLQPVGVNDLVYPQAKQWWHPKPYNGKVEDKPVVFMYSLAFPKCRDMELRIFFIQIPEGKVLVPLIKIQEHLAVFCIFQKGVGK